MNCAGLRLVTSNGHKKSGGAFCWCLLLSVPMMVVFGVEQINIVAQFILQMIITNNGFLVHSPSLSLSLPPPACHFFCFLAEPAGNSHRNFDLNSFWLYFIIYGSNKQL